MKKQTENHIPKKRTYISLFSGAGVGCYGFKEQNFECIATCELMESRMQIQKYNQKCKYSSGYICGDIQEDEIKNKIFAEIEKWKTKEFILDVDVLLATPPCQGMSTANYKKNNEQKRNSLVVEAIKMIKEINPKIFVFENVRAFVKTICTDMDGIDKPILDAILSNLNETYNISYKIINFKDYGVPSSRPRTLVIGTRKDLVNLSPFNLFPFKEKEISLKEAIGNLKPLEDFDAFDEEDIYHSFRNYDAYMREWIHDLKEGQTAFDNPEEKKPYKMVHGKKVILKSEHLGNKFRRLVWDKPCACVTTRNDQLASMDTLHPRDDRVLSIRELMCVMTIPKTFKWCCEDTRKIITKEQREAFSKKNELTIRRCIGEAVPTRIMEKIAINIKDMLEYNDFINASGKLENYNKNNYYIASYLFEKSVSNHKESGSFYTPQSIIFDCLKKLQNLNLKKIRVLEPSVGGGNFVLPLINAIDHIGKIELDLVDSNPDAIKELKKKIKKYKIDSTKIKIHYYVEDFIEHDMSLGYDIVIGNPPYFKLKAQELEKYRGKVDVSSGNIYGLFLEKIYSHAENIIMVLPKNFLMVPELDTLRKKYESYDIVSLIDYGVDGFKDVFIEIISIHFQKNYKDKIYIENKRDKTISYVDQKYIFHDKMWLIYRNAFFDEYIKKFELDYFDFYRDRQITNKYLKKKGKYQVLRSKNITDTGKIISIPNYDRFIDDPKPFLFSKYLNKDAIIFPNFTYNIRATKLPKNTLANGSIVVAYPKNGQDIEKINTEVYSTKAFREYYSIVKNKSRFTINIDRNTMYYIGKLKEDEHVYDL